MKKVLSFTLAVVLAFTFLLGSAFASSGVTVVAPDTFISWGSAGDLTSLAVPSDAVSDGRRYIVYQVRDWVVSYFRVRFVIDSFSRGDVVEGETLSWTRYTGEWGLGVNAALEPASYEVEYHASEEYTYSQNFLHLPVKSNFDYYDANGDLIISGSGYVNDFEGLMDLTLTDGTVIQVPRRLVGNQFVVVRSASDSNRYKIWNFGSPDTLDGIYEGAEGVSYSTSVGSFVPGFDISPLPSLGDLYPWDFSVYPYFVVAGYEGSSAGVFYGTAYALSSVDSVYLDSSSFSSGTFALRKISGVRIDRLKADLLQGVWSDSWSVGVEGSSDTWLLNVNADYIFSNFDILSESGVVLFRKNISLGDGSWSWSDWESSTDTLALTSYGDIVYQTFDYPLSNPDDEPSESPEPEPSPSPGGTPDDSNNGLFAWLKTQWVFLLQKLQNIVDAIKNLSVDLDPYPDKTKPLLDDFFTNIFDNGVGEDDVAGLGGVLQNVRPWFNTDFKLADLWDLFDEAYMTSWFTDETRIALDSTGGDLNS